MSKLVTGAAAADLVDIEAPVSHNVSAVAKAKGCSPQDVTVVILDRPRHEQLVSEVRAAGARIKLITDGDVAGAIMAARDGTGVDLLLGIGGTPEGIIAACAVKCLGGIIQGGLAPRDADERDRAIAAGHDLKQVLRTDDLVASEDAFFAATGITDGELVAGVRCRAGSATTQSLVMRARSVPPGPSPVSTSSGSSAPTARSTSTVPADHGVSGPAARSGPATVRTGGAAYAPGAPGHAERAHLDQR